MKKSLKIIITIYILIIISLTGCSAGGGNPVGALGNDEDYRDEIDLAWQYLNEKDFEQSLIIFNKVKRESSKEYDVDEAKAGMGWSYLKMGDFGNALNFFDQVNSGSQELFIGRASIFMLGNSTEKYKEALLMLRNAGLSEVTDVLKLSYNIDISREYCYALAGIIYYYNGMDNEAKKHLQKVKESTEYDFDQRLKRIYDAIAKDLLQSN